MRYALLDWDNSLHNGWTLHEWVKWLCARGRYDFKASAEISEAFEQYEQGRISYASLAKRVPEAYARGLKGQPISAISAEAQVFAVRDRHEMFDYVPRLLHILREHSIVPVIVSGSPSEALLPHAHSLGIANLMASKARGRGTTYDGTLAYNMATAEGKQRAAATYATKGSVVVALGDSEADRPLFEAASVLIAVSNFGLGNGNRNTLHLDPNSAERSMQRLAGMLAESPDQY